MRFALALLASALALPATVGEAQLLPFGQFAARDGRPGPGKKWSVSNAQGRKLAADINAVALQTPIVIDYDHQTIRAEKNGQLAPAAGWILGAEWRDGVGLFGRVEWTPAAKARIESGEYRYISPVIADDAAGNVVGVHLAALLNHPALLGMDAVMAQLAAEFSRSNPTHTTQGNDMDLLIALATLMGLASGADQAAVLAAVSDLKARADAPPKGVPIALGTALGLPAGADEAAALAALAALKGTDTGTLQAMTALQGQVATLTAQINEGGIVGLVDSAIAAHKLMPVQRDWALGLGRKDRTALQGYIDSAVVIPGLGGQSGGGERVSALATNLPPAELARKATAWQSKQAAAGVQITTAQAVNEVIGGAQ